MRLMYWEMVKYCQSEPVLHCAAGGRWPKFSSSGSVIFWQFLIRWYFVQIGKDNNCSLITNVNSITSIRIRLKEAFTLIPKYVSWTGPCTAGLYGTACLYGFEKRSSILEPSSLLYELRRWKFYLQLIFAHFYIISNLNKVLHKHLLLRFCLQFVHSIWLGIL